MSLVLKSSEFRKEREASWRDLEMLIELARANGIQSLPTGDLERLPLLYRSALSSLSVARSIALDRALIEYLENLSLRAFLAVYARPASILASVSAFFAREWPRAVRAIGRHVAAVLFVLVLGVFSGFVLVNADEGWYPVIVPAGLAQGRTPASTRAELLKVLSSRASQGSLWLMANILFSNNTLVSLLTFGLGFAAGVPTLLLTFGNALILGAFIALHHHRSLTGEFLGWVSIHGVTELGALVLFAAAGLRIGELVLFPGKNTRAAALAQGGSVVATVAVGGVVMLLLAAVLEGVFRQIVRATDARLFIGLASLVLWTGYFTIAGRRKDP